MPCNALKDRVLDQDEELTSDMMIHGMAPIPSEKVAI